MGRTLVVVDCGPVHPDDAFAREFANAMMSPLGGCVDFPVSDRALQWHTASQVDALTGAVAPAAFLSVGASEPGMTVRRDGQRVTAMVKDQPAASMYAGYIETGHSPVYLPRRTPLTDLTRALQDIAGSAAPVFDVLRSWACAAVRWVFALAVTWWRRPMMAAQQAEQLRAAELERIQADAPDAAAFAEENGMLTSAAVWREIADGA